MNVGSSGVGDVRSTYVATEENASNSLPELANTLDSAGNRAVETPFSREVVSTRAAFVEGTAYFKGLYDRMQPEEWPNMRGCVKKLYEAALGRKSWRTNPKPEIYTQEEVECNFRMYSKMFDDCRSEVESLVRDVRNRYCPGYSIATIIEHTLFRINNFEMSYKELIGAGNEYFQSEVLSGLPMPSSDSESDSD